MPKIKGKLVKVSDRFWKNGWGYGTIEAGSRKIKITGTLQDIPLGTAIQLTGVWEDSKYGQSFNFRKLEAVLEDFSVQLWLKELPDVGPVRAAQIVATFGDEIEDILINRPSELQSISGITEERAVAIGVAYDKDKDTYRFVQDMAEVGFTILDAKKLCKRFTTIEEIDPYDLYLRGMLEYEVARDITLPSTRRREAGCYWSIKQVQDDTGDTVFNITDIVDGGEIADYEELLEWCDGGAFSLIGDDLVALTMDYIKAADIRDCITALQDYDREFDPT